MFAVVKTGGKQYKVKKGDKIIIEKIEGKAGDKVKFDQVLLVKEEKGIKIGTPLVKDAYVEAQILEQKRGPKVIIFKYKPKKRYRKKQGHRQPQTVVKIEKIVTARLSSKAFSKKKSLARKTAKKSLVKRGRGRAKKRDRKHKA